MKIHFSVLLSLTALTITNTPMLHAQFEQNDVRGFKLGIGVTVHNVPEGTIPTIETDMTGCIDIDNHVDLPFDNPRMDPADANGISNGTMNCYLPDNNKERRYQAIFSFIVGTPTDNLLGTYWGGDVVNFTLRGLAAGDSIKGNVYIQKIGVKNNFILAPIMDTVTPLLIQETSHNLNANPSLIIATPLPQRN